MQTANNDLEQQLRVLHDEMGKMASHHRHTCVNRMMQQMQKKVVAHNKPPKRYKRVLYRIRSWISRRLMTLAVWIGPKEVVVKEEVEQLGGVIVDVDYGVVDL